MSTQRDYLPAFGPETDIAFHELPDYDFLIGQQCWVATELLPYQSRCPSVIHDRGQGKSEFPRQMRDKTCGTRFVLTVDAKEAVPEHQNFRARIVLVKQIGAGIDYPRAIDLLRFELPFDLWYLNHPEDVPMPFCRHWFWNQWGFQSTLLAL